MQENRTPTKQISMTIDGHKIIVSFASKHNPNISQLVRSTLLDAYVRKHEIHYEVETA